MVVVGAVVVVVVGGGGGCSPYHYSPYHYSLPLRLMIQSLLTIQLFHHYSFFTASLVPPHSFIGATTLLILHCFIDY